MARQGQDNMDKKIDVVIVEKGIGPYEARTDNTLKAKQQIVGGYTDNYFIHYYEDGSRLAIILGDESKLDKKPINRTLLEANGEVLEAIHGDFLIVRYDSHGESKSLTPDEIEELVEMFIPPVVMLKK